ncbi:unnamed protein product [Knipowitschia caucasica]
MELPLGGPALRHYTQSRPRPHRQKLNYRPTRLQETIIECENEDFELMGRVDEGVEEFFTKKVLPTETLEKEEDDGEEEEEEMITVHEVAPASTVSCPPPSKTLRRKLGDFFTLKKRRGLKSEPSQEGRPKKASIADFIRPLREVARGEKDKDKDKVKEHDKENEKGKCKDIASPGEPVQGKPNADTLQMRESVAPRRALREGKSQSLILLSGSASGASRNKKLDGQNSFEQKLHLMLQRIGVSKPQSGETQNQEGEMKKAESEGTIIDNKPEPPTAKPRTMSASSDTRHQLRSSVSAHESAGKPPLLPKPVIKPGPPTTLSGRTTPENELGQIEGKPNGLFSKGAEAAPAVSTSSSLTISDPAPDTVTVLPLSKSDTHVCTESSVEAKAPADKGEQDCTATITAEAPTEEIALKVTTPTETPTTVCDSTFIETVATSCPSTVTVDTEPSGDNSSNSTKLSETEPNSTTDSMSPSTSTSHIPAGQSNNVVTTGPCTLANEQSESANTAHDIKATTPEIDILSDDLMTVFNSTSAADTTIVATMSFSLPAETSLTAIPETPIVTPSTMSNTSTVSDAHNTVTSIITNEMTDHPQNTQTTACSPPMVISEIPSTAIDPVTVNVSATENDNVTADLAVLSDEHSSQSPPEASLTEDAVNFTSKFYILKENSYY